MNALAPEAIASRTAAIVERVRHDGDVALRELALELDGVRLEGLEVPRCEWSRALAELDPVVRRAMERAMRNIDHAHRAFAPVQIETETEPGVVVGRRPDPLACVGVYAPGGTAAYPSSVLMTCLPARAAGVREIVLCSPPGKNGRPADAVLAAAELCGVNRVFAIGGAGAIAAMALGTATVPRVDRIVGPGNVWVAQAKRLLAGEVLIDSPAGPSELLVIADESALPVHVAAEMVAQAEHDVQARVLALVLSEALAVAVRREVDEVLTTTPRAAMARAALGADKVRVVGSVDEAVEIAADFAPEHLLLAVANPDAVLPRVRNAGCVFLGTASSIAFGDYMTGANHVLPTGGTTRRYSGLSTNDFVRWTSYQRVSPAAADRLSTDVAVFAHAEGLAAHAAAAGAHQGGTAIEPCDLSDNRNLFGVAPAARRELAALDVRVALPYPSADDDLRRAFAEYLGCGPENVVTGNGSDQVIELVFRALAGGGGTIAWCEPTFSMVPVVARGADARTVVLPGSPSGTADVRGLLATNADLIYLCSPNNPTGAATTEHDLGMLLANGRGIVVIDEAYAEYAGVSFAQRAVRAGNVVVIRTMSKAFGLAGLRVGAGVAAPDLVRRIASWRAPFSVNAMAQRVAARVLREDVPWMQGIVAETRRAREALITQVRSLGVSPLPSDANFVLLPIASARAIARRLAALGVQARAFTGLGQACTELQASGGEAIRVTVGPLPLVQSFVRALTRVLDEGGRCA